MTDTEIKPEDLPCYQCICLAVCISKDGQKTVPRIRNLCPLLDEFLGDGDYSTGKFHEFQKRFLAVLDYLK